MSTELDSLKVLSKYISNTNGYLPKTPQQLVNFSRREKHLATLDIKQAHNIILIYTKNLRKIQRAKSKPVGPKPVTLDSVFSDSDSSESYTKLVSDAFTAYNAEHGHLPRTPTELANQSNNRLSLNDAQIIFEKFEKSKSKSRSSNTTKTKSPYLTPQTIEMSIPISENDIKNAFDTEDHIIDINPQLTDVFEEIKQEQHLTQHPTMENNDSIKLHEHSLLSEMFTKIKIALTFLLCDKSPLNHNNKNGTFIDRCMQYGMDSNTDVNGYTEKVDNLYTDIYKQEHMSIYNVWKKWIDYAQKHKSMNNMASVLQKCHEFIKENESYLERNCDEFVENKYVLKKPNRSILNTLTIRTDTTRTTTSKHRSNRIPDELKFSILSPEDELPLIKDRTMMKEWLKKYKLNHDVDNNRLACCSPQKYTVNTKRQKNLSTPLDVWQWENVVAFIEDQEDIHHLASIFWQYRINGKELCKLDTKQIELLIECSLLNNHNIDENDFESLKTATENDWELTETANCLLYEIDKARIDSHIISHYHLLIDMIKAIIKDNNRRYSQYYQDAVNINQLILLLRTPYHKGPQQFWKIDSYFFNKIDNILAVLISDNVMRKMYQKCCIDFLYESKKLPSNYVEIIMQENIEKQAEFEHQNRLLLMGKSNKFPSMRSVSFHKQSTSSFQLRKSMMSKISLLEQKNNYSRHHLTLNVVNTIKDQCMDKICFEFVKNNYKETIYLQLLCLVVISILTGSLFVIFWFYTNGIQEQLLEPMALSVESVSERVKNKIIDEFWVPQMLLSIAIGGLYNGDLTSDAASKGYGAYDAFFAQFNNIEHTQSIFSLGLYKNVSNTLLTAYRSDGDTQIMIGNYNGTCRDDYAYTKHHDVLNITTDCSYNPRQRKWYKLAMENIGISKWTEPYSFTEGKDNFGIALVTAIEFEHTILVFLCEINIRSFMKHVPLDRYVTTRGTTIMVATPAFDIIASSNGDIHLNVSGCSSCTALRDTVDWLKNKRFSKRKIHTTLVTTDLDNHYSVSINSFEMVYLNFIPLIENNKTHLLRPLLLNNESDYQYGNIIIVNDDSFLDDVFYILMISFILVTIMLASSTVLICLNMKYYNDEITHQIQKRFRDRLRYNNGERIKQMTLMKNAKAKKRNQASPQIGNIVKTTNGKIGTIKNITTLDEDSSFHIIELELSSTKQTIFTNLENIIVQKSESSNDNNDQIDDEKEQKIDPENAHFNENSNYIASDYSRNHCLNFSQKQLLIISFLQILLTLFLLFVVWVSFLSNAKSEYTSMVCKQEFGSAADQINKLYDRSEMILNIFQGRYDRNDFNLENETSRNRFFANIMQSFVGLINDPLFNQYSIYMGTPDGRFFGTSWSLDEFTYKLEADIRNENTSWLMNTLYLNDDVTINSTDNSKDEHGVYDPRCRKWYTTAVKHTFTGTISNAFPSKNDSGFNDFIEDDRFAALTDDCSFTRQLFGSMFSEYTDNYYEYNVSNQYKLTWTRYIFFNLEQIGLTASAAIQDSETGDLFGVLGVDFTLGSLSSILFEIVKQQRSQFDGINDSNWYSWIFDAKAKTPEMIASSDYNVLHKEESSEWGSNDKVLIPYVSNIDHPNAIIRTASKEAIDVYGIHQLDNINTNESVSIPVPIEFPFLEAGRINFSPFGGEASIDWVVLQTVKSFEKSASFVIAVIVSFILCCTVLLIMKEFDYQHNECNETDIAEEGIENDINYHYKLMEKMKKIIRGSANAQWVNNIEDNELTNNNVKDIDENILTTLQAKQFMANIANQHIAVENENDKMLLECAIEASATKKSHKFRLTFFRFTGSNLYSIINHCTLTLHLITSLFEPATPTQLKQTGLSSSIVLILSFCILMEWIDVLFIAYVRYIEFSIKPQFLSNLYHINYGPNHTYTQMIKRLNYMSNNSDKLLKRLYLTFMGPTCGVFLLHILLNILILFNFLLSIFKRSAYLSYYFPVLPLLLIIRNETVLKFCMDFIFAVLHAKDVLVSYFCYILIFAILSMSLFRTVVNEGDFSESFESLYKSIITAFVFISTSENYSLMYDIFDSEYYNEHGIVLGNAVISSLAFAFIGLFIFVPFMIHRFEIAFTESRILSHQKHLKQKTNAIIASFLMLDMNGDLDIDEQEFKSLLSSMTDDVDKSKLFESFDEDDNDGIDINEFVSHLLKQTFRTKIMSKHVPKQNKFRAYIECNVIRNIKYKTFVLLIMVLPFLLICMINNNQNVYNYILCAFFILNMMEIHFRMFIYGTGRYWNLLKYPNPNYVSATLSRYYNVNTGLGNYNLMNSNLLNSNIIRLTSSERSWSLKYLSSNIRPLSVLEKATLSLIHKIELVTIWLCLIAFFACKCLFFFNYSNSENVKDFFFNYKFQNDNNIMYDHNYRYAMYFISFGVLFRLFTLIPSNQQLIYVVFTVFPQFISLFAFLTLFIYFWARIGCTLFGDDKTSIVIDEIYDSASNANKTNFNSLGYAMLALLQLLVGEGWHEILYYNVIATNPLNAIYFLIYISIVTIIISNVFIGLFLADIDELATEQSHDQILQQSETKSQSFEKYAKYKENILKYQIQMNDIQTEKMRKQLFNIQKIRNNWKLKKR